MSRVAKQILSTEGVEIIQNGRILNFKGPLGSVNLTLHKDIEIDYNKEAKTIGVVGEAIIALKGTFVRLINNGIIGTTKGFESQIKLVGVGYKAALEGSKVKMNIGFSHPVYIEIPKEAKAEIPNAATIVLKSCNKELLGDLTYRFCKSKKYNVYNGNGVLDSKRHYRRKETKKK